MAKAMQVFRASMGVAILALAPGAACTPAATSASDSQDASDDVELQADAGNHEAGASPDARGTGTPDAAAPEDALSSMDGSDGGSHDDGSQTGWTVTADFDEGMVGQLAQGPSGFTAAYTQTFFSAATVHSGPQSASAFFPQGSAGGTAGGSITFPTALGDGAELWARGYFYFQSPWSWTCSPVIKIFRGAHIQDSGGNNVGYLSVFSDTNGNIVLSNEPGDVQTYTQNPFDVGAWQSIEMYVRLSVTQPLFRIWKNGTLLIEDATTPTLGSSTDQADFSYVFTYWNGGAPQDQTAYVDDLVYTTTRPSKHDANGNSMIGP